MRMFQIQERCTTKLEEHLVSLVWLGKLKNKKACISKLYIKGQGHNEDAI